MERSVHPLKKLLALATGAALLTTLTACDGSGTAAVPAVNEVNVYNWGEYIDQS